MKTELKVQAKNILQPIIIREMKQYRTSHGLSQEKMARMLKISVRTYIDSEHGKCFPSAVTLAVFLTLLSADTVSCMIDEMSAALE